MIIVMDALINLEMLKWARLRSGLTIEAVANKFKKTPKDIELWESGDKKLSFKQLLRIAEIYKRPIPLFYLKEPPEDFQSLNDYRKLPNTELPISPQLNYEIRKAHYRRQVALELLEGSAEHLQVLKSDIQVTDDPEAVGIKIRSKLCIEYTEQIKWKEDNEAFNSWRNAIESLGILVFQAERVEVSEMRGFAISDYPLPAIVVNKKDTHKGRIFSMMHELAHIFLGDSSISGEDLYFEQEKIEVFCNQVAASILLPSTWFDNDELLLDIKNSNKWDDEAVDIIAQRFNISRESVWRRLLTNNIISQDVYRQKRDQLIEQYKIQKRQKNERKPIIVPHHTKVISTIGKFYAKLVLSSYHEEKITSSTLSEYLGIKLKHLPKIETSMLRGN